MRNWRHLQECKRGAPASLLGIFNTCAGSSAHGLAQGLAAMDAASGLNS